MSIGKKWRNLSHHITVVMNLGCPPGAPQAALSLSFHQQDRGKKIQQKAHGRSPTSCHHGQNKSLLREVKLIYCQLNSRIMRNKNKTKNTFPPPLPPSQAQLHSLLFSLLTAKWHRGTVNGLHSQFIVLCLCHSFLFTGFRCSQCSGQKGAASSHPYLLWGVFGLKKSQLCMPEAVWPLRRVGGT